MWDAPNLTLAELRVLLQDPDPAQRSWWIAKVMAQARPDDALMLVRPAEIAALWPHIEGNLGRKRELWTWLLQAWKRLGLVGA